MQQFSPKVSKIFAAAAFTNLYSSVLFKTVRSLSATVLLALILVSAAGNLTNILYLTVSVAIVFSIFEIFYHAKILNEKPTPLKETKNPADAFSFETVQQLLKI